MKNSESLACYASNVTSQGGEDGIIQEIFNRIGEGSRICVEFGAWDGKHLSNTWTLWHDKGWRGVLIEGDSDKARELQKRVAGFPAVIPICEYVGIEGSRKLDAILEKSGIPFPVDLVSIDIDGDDYYIFQSLEICRPRVVVIEYNPTIPPHLDMVGPPGSYFGASACSLLSLAESKGYALAACTVTNLIFVDAQEYKKLAICELELEAIMPREHLTYLITAYDGRTYLSRQPTYAAPFSKNSLREAMRVRSVSGRVKMQAPKELLGVRIFADD